MYKFLNENQILRLADNVTIPTDPANTDYQNYLAWVAQGNTATPRLTPQEALAEAKESKKQEIRDLHQTACNETVNAQGNDWDGGFESAIKLDAARRLAEAAGLTNTIFYDAQNTGHTLTLSNALLVCIAVASDYQTKLAKKQSAFNSIDSATTIQSVNLVSY